MADYKLKLYLNHEYSAEERIGTLGFNAGNDVAAIQYATDMFAEGLSDCDHAVILDQGDKLVWEKGRPLA
jgi:hypothetical protein